MRHRSNDSATTHETDPEIAEWSTRLKTNAILADLFDGIALLNANLVALASGKPAEMPEPYPRPGYNNTKNNQNSNKRHYGSGAMPVNELHEWFEEKRREHVKKHG